MQTGPADAGAIGAVLIGRVYMVFPLVCPKCGGQMGLIAFITEGIDIRKILERIGVDDKAPADRPRAGASLGKDCDAPVGGRVVVEPHWMLGSVIRRLKGLDFLSVFPRHRPSSLI